jgi:hypothetical protein
MSCLSLKDLVLKYITFAIEISKKTSQEMDSAD